MRDNPFKYKLERTRRYKIRIKFCNRTSSISYLTIKKAAIEARSGKDPITDFCPLCSFKIVDKFNNRIVEFLFDKY